MHARPCMQAACIEAVQLRCVWKGSLCQQQRERCAMHMDCDTSLCVCVVCVLMCVGRGAATGAESRHKSMALWEKLLARQAVSVRAIRHRAAVAHNPGAIGMFVAANGAVCMCMYSGRSQRAASTGMLHCS